MQNICAKTIKIIELYKTIWYNLSILSYVYNGVYIKRKEGKSSGLLFYRFEPDIQKFNKGRT